MSDASNNQTTPINARSERYTCPHCGGRLNTVYSRSTGDFGRTIVKRCSNGECDLKVELITALGRVLRPSETPAPGVENDADPHYLKRTTTRSIA